MFSLLLITFVFLLVLLVLTCGYLIYRVKQEPGNVGTWVILTVVSISIIVVGYFVVREL